MKKYFVLILLSFVITAGAYLFKIAPQQKTEIKRVDVHYTAHSNPELYAHIEKIGEAPISERVFGGIVSHHFYAEKEISGFFQALQRQRPSVIVLIGPNHFSAGTQDILISRYSYDTPWGVLESEHNIVSRLLESSVASSDELPFEHEHSISTLTGFIKHSFPETKIVPIILKRSTPTAKLDALVSELNNVLPKDSLVLGSIDFSHHQNRFGAVFHDTKSIAVMQSFAFSQIKNLEIDSPPTLYTVLAYMDVQGAHRIQHSNTNSALISGNMISEDVTSYIFAHFLEGPRKADPVISILAFGDSMFDRGLKLPIRDEWNPLEKIRGVEGNFFRGQDALLINLEGPITDSTECQTKSVTFSFPPETAMLLFENKVTHANLANNHSFDCYEKGVRDTVNYLREAGINYFGTFEQAAFVQTVGEQTIAYLGIDLLGASNDAFKAAGERVRKLKEVHDYVVVSVHWGVEYARVFSDMQQTAGHILIDNGADLVLGHHPHVIQPVEIYKGKPIFYSLGNFVFDQVLPETMEGIGVGGVFKESGNEYYIFPYTIVQNQPVLKPYSASVEFCRAYLANLANKKDDCIFYE